MRFISLLARLARGVFSGGIQGSGRVVTEELVMTGFDRVEVGNSFEVTISRAGLYDIIVEADDNLIRYLDVRKSAETLSIRLQSGISIRNATLKVQVTLPELRSVSFSGASRGRIQGFDTGQFGATLSGASYLSGDIVTGDTEISLSGASAVELTGTGPSLSLKASGASKADLEQFKVNTAAISLSGASAAGVTVLDVLEPVSLSGASRLTYAGNLVVRKLHTSGASTVNSE